MNSIRNNVLFNELNDQRVVDVLVRHRVHLLRVIILVLRRFHVVTIDIVVVHHVVEVVVVNVLKDVVVMTIDQHRQFVNNDVDHLHDIDRLQIEIERVLVLLRKIIIEG